MGWGSNMLQGACSTRPTWPLSLQCGRRSVAEFMIPARLDTASQHPTTRVLRGDQERFVNVGNRMVRRLCETEAVSVGIWRIMDVDRSDRSNL